MNKQQIYWAFSILGLPTNATKEQAKHAYRLLCKEYHPDKSNSENSKQKYLLVQQAYEIVSYVLELQQKSPAYFQSAISNVSAHNQYYGNTTVYYNYEKHSGGRIFGNNETVQQNYNHMQQRKAETTRLRQWENSTQRKKDQEKKKMVQELLNSRKLPSQSELEKWKELETKREAERIAGIIEKLLKMNKENS